MDNMASWLGKPRVEIYNDVYVKYLPLNYAYVFLNSTSHRYGLYTVDDTCYKCLPRRVDFESPYYSKTTPYFNVNTAKQHTWMIIKHNSEIYLQPGYEEGLLCEMRPNLGDFGVYTLHEETCSLETEVEPVNPYLSLLLFSLILLTCSITAYGLVKLFKKRREVEPAHNDGLDLTAGPDNLDVMPSLHFFRGILLILIIFVTTGGGGYPVFITSYGGLTVAECLILAFSLSVGLKIPVIFDEHARRLTSETTVFFTILARSVFIFIIGIAISANAPRSWLLSAPLFAPLCRLAVAYLICAIIYMFRPKNNPIQSKDIFTKTYSNMLSLMWGWILTGLLLIFMIVSIQVFYLTGCKPNLESERLGWPLDGNYCQDDKFHEVVNKVLLGMNRDEPFYIESYYAFSDGLLGVVSALLASLIGLKAGVVYVHNDNHSDKIKLWFLHATILALAGIVFAGKSNSLNFNLWPIATVFLVSSLTLYIYSFIYYLTEVRGITSSIIISCGVASIAVLALHLLFSQSFPFYWGESLNTHFFYLWQCTWIVGLWIVLTVCMMKSRVALI